MDPEPVARAPGAPALERAIGADAHRETSPAAAAVTRAGSVVLLGLFLAALSLRPQLVGAAPLIPEIQLDLGMTHAAAGLIGTIPVLCMGLFAPLAPLLAVRFGSARAVAAAVGSIALFGLLRGIASNGAELMVLTVGVGVGMGVAGALLPVVVKECLANRPVAGSVAYSAGLQLGSAASAALAVPVALAVGGWRGALVILSVATLLALAGWVLLVARHETGSSRITVTRLDFSDPRGWLLAATFALFGIVYYGLISWLADAYVELGWAPASAGGLVALLNVASLIGAVTIGGVVGRFVGYGAALISLAVGFAAATIGFAAIPDAGAGWALLAGYTNGALFPLVIAMPLRLTGSPDRVAGLASVMLGGGYTVAALSPIGLGALRDASGSFHASLGALVAVAVVFVVGVALVARLPTPAGIPSAP